MFGLKLGLDVDALLEENALEQRVLVPEHEALVGCGAVGSIEVGQGLLLHTDRLLELLDVLGAAFSEGSLGLSVPLLPLLGSGIDLQHVSGCDVVWQGRAVGTRTRRTGLRPPLRLGACSGAGLAVPTSPCSADSPSGLEPKGDSSLSCLIASFFSSGGLSDAIPLAGGDRLVRHGGGSIRGLCYLGQGVDKLAVKMPDA